MYVICVMLKNSSMSGSFGVLGKNVLVLLLSYENNRVVSSMSRVLCGMSFCVDSMMGIVSSGISRSLVGFVRGFLIVSSMM